MLSDFVTLRRRRYALAHCWKTDPRGRQSCFAGIALVLTYYGESIARSLSHHRTEVVVGRVRDVGAVERSSRPFDEVLQQGRRIYRTTSWVKHHGWAPWAGGLLLRRGHLG